MSLPAPCAERAQSAQIRHVQRVRVEHEAAPGTRHHGRCLVVAADEFVLKARKPAILQEDRMDDEARECAQWEKVW